VDFAFGYVYTTAANNQVYIFNGPDIDAPLLAMTGPASELTPREPSQRGSVARRGESFMRTLAYG